MPLQVRFAHATLGKRVLELPDRPASEPLIIGRIASEVDLALPVNGVSRRHCALYVHEGQWAIYDLKSSTGTFVNGQRITEPTYLSAGDVVTVGDRSAPVAITIGRTRATVAQDAATGVTAAPPAAAEDDLAASAEAALGPGRKLYVPHQQTMGPGLIVATVVLAAGIVAGAWYLYQQRLPKGPVVIVKPPPATTRSAAEVAAEAAARERERRAAEIAAALPSARGAMKSADGENLTAASDEGRGEDWARVTEGRMLDPLQAIPRFDDYLRLHPGTPYAADLRAYTEEALDKLWWGHVSELVDQRASLQQQLAANKEAISQSQDADYKKSAGAERDRLKVQLDQVQKQLTAMNYLSEEKPNLFDKAQITALRIARDPAVYAKWKASAEETIKESRGTRKVGWPE